MSFRFTLQSYNGKENSPYAVCISVPDVNAASRRLL
jgi:hypothetical protein